MHRRYLLTAPLFAMALARGAVVKPETLPAFREGLDAMSSHLWDIAGLRFESLLQTPDLDAAGKKLILFHLVEARIRAGDFAGADKLLADPALKDDPEQPFWKAQALTGNGKLREALDLLDEKALAPAAPHAVEAAFSRSALQQSLGDSKSALDTLVPLLKDKNPANVERAKIRSAIILLGLNRAADALAMLPPDASVKGARAAETSILRAKALLATGDDKAAGTIFSQLLASDRPAYRLQKQEAAIGLAQSQLASGQRANATDGLLAFLQAQEGAPRQGPVFEQLYRCLPENDISPNDTILRRLEGWLPPPAPRPPLGFIADETLAGISGPGDALTSFWPVTPPATNDFSVQALYYLALGLRREGSEALKAESRQLLSRLLVEYGSHPLALRALWELAQWNLEDTNHREEASLVLEGIERLAARNAGENSLEQAAQITAAHRQFLAGDFKQAGAILKEASRSLTGSTLRAVSIDAGSALLANGDLQGFDAFAHSEAAVPFVADLSLERALFLASRRDPAAIRSLDQFVVSNPGHPRISEARLASAHAALEASVPDVTLARTQLENIPAGAEVPAGSLALAQIRVAAQSGDWTQAANLAQAFLDAHPDDPRVEEITFELGNARFQSGGLNKAQLVFQNLVAAHPDSPLAQPALLLAARSAALGATAQSQKQSITLFDQVIAGKGQLADLARLEKSDVLITMNKLSDAIATLDPWLKDMKKDDPLRLTAGLLLGNALYASENFDRELALYNDLLADLPADSPRRFQLKYRCGLALERKGDKARALEAYYSVLDLTKAQQGQVSDWQWIDKCGVGARRILEEGHRWEAAIKVAEKHAALPSPGAGEARDRASTLKLEHMIMDDDDSPAGH